MTLEEELQKLRELAERMRAELRAYKRALPGWVYSPKGDCLYDVDEIDRGDEF